MNFPKNPKTIISSTKNWWRGFWAMFEPWPFESRSHLKIGSDVVPCEGRWWSHSPRNRFRGGAWAARVKIHGANTQTWVAGGKTIINYALYGLLYLQYIGIRDVLRPCFWFGPSRIWGYIFGRWWTWRKWWRIEDTETWMFLGVLRFMLCSFWLGLTARQWDAKRCVFPGTFRVGRPKIIAKQVPTAGRERRWVDCFSEQFMLSEVEHCSIARRLHCPGLCFVKAAPLIEPFDKAARWGGEWVDGRLSESVNEPWLLMMNHCYVAATYVCFKLLRPLEGQSLPTRETSESSECSIDVVLWLQP